MRVKWTVTKDISDLPAEVSKVLSEARASFADISKNIERVESSISLDAPFSSITRVVSEQIEQLLELVEFMKDIEAICKSISSLETARETDELKQKIQDNVNRIQAETDLRIGQLAATEKMYAQQIEFAKEENERLREEVKKLSPRISQKKKKTTNKG